MRLGAAASLAPRRESRRREQAAGAGAVAADARARLPNNARPRALRTHFSPALDGAFVRSALIGGRARVEVDKACQQIRIADCQQHNAQEVLRIHWSRMGDAHTAVDTRSSALVCDNDVAIGERARTKELQRVKVQSCIHVQYKHTVPQVSQTG